MKLKSSPAGFFFLLCSLINSANGQTLLPPPGVPEPGLIIWGTVVNVNDPSQPVAITSVSWSVTDGTKTAVYTAATKPPTRIVPLDGQSYYVLEVPFDTRTFGTIALADPDTIGIQSFELKAASPPTYTLTPTINGVLATVRSVDGAPGSGGSIPVSGFNAAVRGRVVRVDLAINPPTDPYEVWAAGFFGNATIPNAARMADPDGDGLTNEQEYLAGTNPTEAASSLRLLTISVNPGQNQVTIGWQSASNKNYLIETASAVAGPWAEAGSPVSSAGSTTQISLNRAPASDQQYYRVRIAP
ncbi:MAG: thrombospondin type 3 repeat-containing protein [Verrucomicrobiales bacterium]|nr:thrombospondin type 3 repeat-containing protein [Verrucomicrobiales bacterium]